MEATSRSKHARSLPARESKQAVSCFMATFSPMFDTQDHVKGVTVGRVPASSGDKIAQSPSDVPEVIVARRPPAGN